MAQARKLSGIQAVTHKVIATAQAEFSIDVTIMQEAISQFLKDYCIESNHWAFGNLNEANDTATLTTMGNKLADNLYKALRDTLVINSARDTFAEQTQPQPPARYDADKLRDNEIIWRLKNAIQVCFSTVSLGRRPTAGLLE